MDRNGPKLAVSEHKTERRGKNSLQLTTIGMTVPDWQLCVENLVKQRLINQAMKKKDHHSIALIGSSICLHVQCPGVIAVWVVP